MKTWMMLALSTAATSGWAGVTAPTDALPEAPPSPWGVAFTFASGYRHDDFEWSIAGDSKGRNPNVLSELDWSDLSIIPAGGAMDLTWRDHWHLRLAGSYGWIVDGRNRDSDYDEDGRRREFSRSHAKTDGEVADVEALAGYDFHLPGGRIVATPWAGYAFHRQSLNDHDGVQQVDREGGPLGSFPGLDSLYAARWSGPVAGLEAEVLLAPGWRAKAGVAYQWLRYSAHGDWNLRPDLDGFTHKAEGGLWQIEAGVEWDFRPRWTLGLKAMYLHASTTHGKDDTKSYEGFHATTRLNEVRWTSLGANASICYRF